MPYTANIPKNKRYAGRGENRTCDKDRSNGYPINTEGLPNSKTVVIQYLSGDAAFYSIEDVAEKTGWSIRTVQKLFNAPDFPSTDFGKRKLVEAHAFIGYFAVKRERADSNGYWE